MKTVLKVLGWVLAITAIFVAAAWAITKVIDKYERHYAQIPAEDDVCIPF